MYAVYKLNVFRACAFGKITAYDKTGAAIMNKKESDFFVELDLAMRKFSKHDLLNTREKPKGFWNV
jgi:hypothetical protein